MQIPARGGYAVMQPGAEQPKARLLGVFFFLRPLGIGQVTPPITGDVFRPGGVAYAVHLVASSELHRRIIRCRGDGGNLLRLGQQTHRPGVEGFYP